MPPLQKKDDVPDLHAHAHRTNQHLRQLLSLPISDHCRPDGMLLMEIDLRF